MIGHGPEIESEAEATRNTQTMWIGPGSIASDRGRNARPRRTVTRKYVAQVRRSGVGRRTWATAANVNRSPVSSTTRRVKGTLFVDYVRMLRRRSDVDWSRISSRSTSGTSSSGSTEPGTPWEPSSAWASPSSPRSPQGNLDSVRMLRARLDRLAVQDVRQPRRAGRPARHADALPGAAPELLRLPGARDRFDLGRRGVDRRELRMGPRAEEAASWQTLGFFERLLEVAGARR